MMIQDHYEVNIARREKRMFDNVERYYHYCRVEITDPNQKAAEEKFDVITKAFPAPEYKCTLSFVECRGHQLKEV